MSNEQWLGFNVPGSSFEGAHDERFRSAKVAALSIAIHVSIFLLVWATLIVISDTRFPSRLSAIHIPLTLQKLTRLPPPAGRSSGGGGGEHSLLPASRGAAPPPAIHKTWVPILVTNPDAKLQIQPSIDTNAPQILADQWGDPLATSGVFSNGPGKNGIGDGKGGDGKGPFSGSGHDGGGMKAYALTQVNVQPVLILKIEPEYSEQARQAHYQGSVGLRIVIDEHGVPRHISVVRTLGLGLDEKALEAISHWRFKPALKDGKPVAVEAFIDVNFRLL